MDEIDQWLEQTRSRALYLSEAYRLRLGVLWWANLMFVVLPAVFSTAAAIFAALPSSSIAILSLPLASVLAGSAAVLTAVHKALKCDEYQAECRQLSHDYQSVSIAADAALFGPTDDRAAQFDRIRNDLENLSRNASVQISTSYMASALETAPTK
ncbi:MAG: hypothetical protein QNI99_19600 [Woeseiaceae bacterium]|nr:hypothetical protein [Woeseiaceae bacterium]